jgi:hypothetical protein
MVGLKNKINYTVGSGVAPCSLCLCVIIFFGQEVEGWFFRLDKENYQNIIGAEPETSKRGGF